MTGLNMIGLSSYATVQLQVSDYTVRLQLCRLIKAVYAPIIFEEIVMVMINDFITLLSKHNMLKPLGDTIALTACNISRSLRHEVKVNITKHCTRPLYLILLPMLKI